MSDAFVFINGFKVKLKDNGDNTYSFIGEGLDALDDSVTIGGGALDGLEKQPGLREIHQQVVTVPASGLGYLFQTRSSIILEHLEVAVVSSLLSLRVLILGPTATPILKHPVKSSTTSKAALTDEVTTGGVVTIGANWAKVLWWKGVKNADSSLYQVYFDPQLMPMYFPHGIEVRANNPTAGELDVAVSACYRVVGV